MWPDGSSLDVSVLVGAVLLDLLFPEPPNVAHPVVWMGRLVRTAERWAPATGRAGPLAFGVFLAVALPGAFAVAAWLAGVALLALGPVPHAVGGALLLRTTFTVRGLGRAARAVVRPLEGGATCPALARRCGGW